MKYFDDYDQIKVYPIVGPIPHDTEISDQRIRDFFSQTELNPSSRPGLKIRRDYIGDSMPFERQMASPQRTKVIPQSTTRVPPSDGRPESVCDLMERDHHDSNDECEDDSPANNAQLRKSQRDEAEERDSNDDFDDDSPPDNALRDKAESARIRQNTGNKSSI